MRFLRVGRAPDLLEQFLAADEFPAVAHQHLEHPPFGRGQMHLGAVAGDLLRGEVDGERRSLDDGFFGVGRRRGTAHRGS
jgi:hypothetical protein